MDIEASISDSFGYAKEALVGKWERWAIFILLSLPVLAHPVPVRSKDDLDPERR